MKTIKKLIPGCLMLGALTTSLAAENSDKTYNNTYMDTTERSLALMREFFEDMLREDDPGKYEHYLHPDVILNGPATGQIEHGIARLRELDNGYAKAFGKKNVTIHALFAKEDKIVINWTLYGTHRGEFEGIQKSGKDIVVSGQSIYRIEEGKIREIWQSWDRLGLLEQIGDVQVLPHSDPQSAHEFLKALGLEKYYEKSFLLSKRERECLKYLVQGKTAKDTAQILSISYRTVESYFENIKVKLGCIHKRDLFAIAQALEKLQII